MPSAARFIVGILFGVYRYTFALAASTIIFNTLDALQQATAADMDMIGVCYDLNAEQKHRARYALAGLGIVRMLCACLLFVAAWLVDERLVDSIYEWIRVAYPAAATEEPENALKTKLLGEKETAHFGNPSELVV